MPNPQHTAACRGGPMCPPNDRRSYRIRKGGGSKGRKWQGRSKCKISGNMSFRHWADTRVRPYRRVMYAEYDRRVMYAEYDRRVMYAEYDRRVMYAEYDRREFGI